jgi:hypothetical protein
MHCRKWLPMLVLLWLSPVAPALELGSGPGQVTLLELFTSQGCSSCPPAERWLNEYLDSPALWREVVPVAWHVDYWDDLGWKDPYATLEGGARQRAYARAGRARSVYTPGFFSNGREWRGWVLRLPPRASGREAGALTAHVEHGMITAHYPAGQGVLDLHVAVLGTGIRTAVSRGENRNRTLPQEFVLLAHAVHPSSTGNWQVALPQVHAAGVTRYGVALWVSATGSLPPLQATGGWLDRSARE